MTNHHDHPHHDHGEHGHSHGLVDRSILRSRAGLKAVAFSLLILGVTAGAQVAIFAFSHSVALLADLIHNFGDALTAVPLGIAFFLRSIRGERLAGLAVVLAIFVSACVALYETVMRFIHPQHLSHLWVLAAAGAIGFLGNEVAAQVRLRAGRRLASRDDRGRQARADRRVRVSRSGRERRGGRARRADRRPDHRSRDHARDPEDHVGLLAHRSQCRDRPRSHRRRSPPPPPLTRGTRPYVLCYSVLAARSTTAASFSRTCSAIGCKLVVADDREHPLRVDRGDVRCALALVDDDVAGKQHAELWFSGE